MHVLYTRSLSLESLPFLFVCYGEVVGREVVVILDGDLPQHVCIYGKQNYSINVVLDFKGLVAFCCTCECAACPHLKNYFIQ